MQNRRLATWLIKDEYESFERDWKSQQQISEELKDKPDELRRYKISYTKPFLTTTKRSVFASEATKVNRLNPVI